MVIGSPRIAARTLGAIRNGEFAEAKKLHGFAFGQGAGQVVERGSEGSCGVEVLIRWSL